MTNNYNTPQYKKLFNKNKKDVCIYKPYEDFSIHGHDFTRDDVIVLVSDPEDHADETKLIAYTPEGRIEEVLKDSELEWSTWIYQLPLADPYMLDQDKRGAYTSSEVFEVLDPIWSNTTVNFYEIQKLLEDVWQISFD